MPMLFLSEVERMYVANKNCRVNKRINMSNELRLTEKYCSIKGNNYWAVENLIALGKLINYIGSTNCW